MMFTKGQLIFAAIFAVAFIIIIFLMYKKDVATHKQYYKGSKWILVGFLTFIAILLSIKFFVKE